MSGCLAFVSPSTLKIGSQAFNGCGELDKVEIRSATTKIAEDAFDELGCQVLIRAPAGSTAEDYVKKYGEEYGLRFQAL